MEGRRRSFIDRRKSGLPAEMSINIEPSIKVDYLRLLSEEKQEWQNVYEERKEMKKKIEEKYGSVLRVKSTDVEMEFKDEEFFCEAPDYMRIVKDIERFQDEVTTFDLYTKDLQFSYDKLKGNLEKEEKQLADKLCLDESYKWTNLAQD